MIAPCIAGLVLTGKNGVIPFNSFFTSNSSVLSPFQGATGEYIRCGSTGGHPLWYGEANQLISMNSSNGIHFNSAPDTGEFWFRPMNGGKINREFRCSPQSGSVTNLSSFIGLFFLHQNKLGEYVQSAFLTILTYQYNMLYCTIYCIATIHC